MIGAGTAHGLAAVAYTAVKTSALFLDGYSFVAANLVSAALCCRLEVGDVRLDRLVTSIADRPGACVNRADHRQRDAGRCGGVFVVDLGQPRRFYRQLPRTA